MEEKHNHTGDLDPKGEEKNPSIFMAQIISANSFQ